MIETAVKVRNIFENNGQDIDLPSFWRFPVGCCEGASLFLGKVLHDLFPKSIIEYVKGYSRDGEMHFWLLVDGLIFDLTADQFPSIKAPILGMSCSPLTTKFSDTEVIPISEAFAKSDVTNAEYKNSLLINLTYALTGEVRS